MKKQGKKYLILGATSDMADFLIKKLIMDGVEIFAVSRSNLILEAENLHKFNTDLSKEENITELFQNFSGMTFDCVINFQGVAITSPVEFLPINELLKQFQISVFSLVSILKNLNGKLNKNSLVINISSMAAFGVFPFLAPYEAAKASADIILNCYETETGIKTVSIKPGCVATRFWEKSIKENERNFSNFKGKYEKIGKFLKLNAEKNSTKGLSPDSVSKLIYKISWQKAPKASYTIGSDAKFISFIQNFKGRILFSIIRKVLQFRVERLVR